MAKIPKLNIHIDIDPIVRVTCWNEACRFNQMNATIDRKACCLLKEIALGQDGKCKNFEPLLEQEPEEKQC